MPRAKRSLHLDDDILRELLFLAKHAVRAEEIIKLAGEVPTNADPEEAVDFVAERSKMPAGEVERLLHTVHNITWITERMRLDTAQFLESVTHALEERGEDFTAVDLAVWRGAIDAIRQAVVKVGPDHPFTVIRKAERLARSQQNVIYETKILTDLRPVFSIAGDKILRSVITHRLFIDYFDGTRVRRIEFGMDAADIAELRKVCERAELKTVTLKESLKGIDWASNAPENGE